MSSSIYAYIAVAFAASALLTWWVRRFALKHGIIDQPNVRSSHSIRTPRGGGLAIVVVASLLVSFGAMTGVVDRSLAVALLGGGMAVAWIGFRDDRGSVPVRVRLAVHALAAIWAMYWLDGVSAIQIGARVVDLGGGGYVLGVLAIVWGLNLFNFMDGIDGIAASEGVFVAALGGAVCLIAGGAMSVALPGMIVAAASAGFLLWNWPPAKIFMGDVGSGYLGFVIVVLALADARENPVALFVWLILGGIFFVDATVTLVRRLANNERVYEAHRSHAYQWLSRRWESHKRVTVTVLMVNLFWLFPCALLAASKPTMAGWFVLVAFIPIVIAAVLSGAGRPEIRSDQGQS